MERVFVRLWMDGFLCKFILGRSITGPVAQDREGDRWP